MKENKLGHRGIHVLMGIAALIWMIPFAAFFKREIALFPDGWSYFNWTRFVYDNITRGVYPLWQPFDNWGYPVGFKIRFLGEFNPLFLLMMIPYKLGISYPVVYFAYAVGYFLLGIYGFYRICLHLTQDQISAYLGFIILLFSNMGIAIFFNYCEIALFVPAVWFFYFFLTFCSGPTRSSLIGMTFAVMMILTTYMPFYFLTAFLAFLVIAAVLYMRDLKPILVQSLRFLIQHRGLTVLCVAAILVSAVPGYITYKETGSSEFSYDHRKADSSESAVTTGVSMVNAGSILGPVTWRGLLFGQKYQDNYLSYFFLPAGAIFILLMTIFNPFNRRLALCLGVALGMFYIVITNASGVTQFLYDRVFFFRIMRNIFYLFYLAVPFVVFFVVEQLRIWMASEKQNGSISRIWILLVATGLIVYLKIQGHALVSIYISVIGIASALIFNVQNFSRWAFALAVTFFFLVHPIDVYRHYVSNVAEVIPAGEIFEPRHPKFHYQRPDFGTKPAFAAHEFEESSGFTLQKFAGTQGAALLQNNTDPGAMSRYTRNKFIAYDQTVTQSFASQNWFQIGRHLIELQNEAIVVGDGESIRQAPASAQVISSDSDLFRVTHFDLNTISFETNFPTRKFIVYNDSYHSGWTARVNGEAGPIWQSNIAFKGLWLEAGPNLVQLRFGSVWLERFYFLLMIVFMLVFAGLIHLLVQERSRE